MYEIQRKENTLSGWCTLAYAEDKEEAEGIRKALAEYREGFEYRVIQSDTKITQ